MCGQPICVSEVKVRMAAPRHAENGPVAWASCVVNGCLCPDGIAVVKEAQGALRAEFPYRRGAHDQKHFPHRPITREAKEPIDQAILSCFPRRPDGKGVEVRRGPFEPKPELPGE